MGFPPLLGRIHKNPELLELRRHVGVWATSLPPHSRVLDAGAGDSRYRDLFNSHVYESADFAQVQGKAYAPIDHVCDLRAIPVADASFDAILCTQVLAHLPEPREALRELGRILRPGGQLLLSCPFSFQENERPFDFYRYTRYGLQHLLEKTGFNVIQLEPLCGYLSLLQYQLGMAAMRLPWRPSGYGGGLVGWIGASSAIFLKPLFAACCQLYTWLELRSPARVSGMNMNWIVEAVRGGEAYETTAPRPGRYVVS